MDNNSALNKIKELLQELAAIAGDGAGTLSVELREFIAVKSEALQKIREDIESRRFAEGDIEQRLRELIEECQNKIHHAKALMKAAVAPRKKTEEQEEEPEKHSPRFDFRPSSATAADAQAAVPTSLVVAFTEKKVDDLRVRDIVVCPTIVLPNNPTMSSSAVSPGISVSAFSKSEVRNVVAERVIMYPQFIVSGNSEAGSGSTPVKPEVARENPLPIPRACKGFIRRSLKNNGDAIGYIQRRRDSQRDKTIFKTIIKGSSGSGKTELAKAYAAEAPYEQKFWLRAEGDLKAQFVSLGHFFGLSLDQYQVENLVFTFYSRILQLGKTVLLVLDNVPDLKNIEHYISGKLEDEVVEAATKTAGGVTGSIHILITCINPVLSLSEDEGSYGIIDLSAFSPEEAMRYINSIPSLRSCSSDQNASLARQLNYFPLSLRSAVGYINSKINGSDITVRVVDEFLGEFTKLESGQKFPDENSRNIQC